MKTESVIKIEKIGKRYFLGKQKNDSLRGALANVLKSSSRNQEEFWALKDVSFNVNKGDVVGIIGKNGAGKSTLLKILSKITKPTAGKIELSGRVASLLEVGTGFHPELTGRENIFLNGTILGMSKTEVRNKLDEIIEFSGVSNFLDTPVKHYSSGMYVRLAFAVAAHLEPDILIIDEVLSVGDIEFQKKSLGKMSDISKSGRTILFVSHNLLAVESLCNKAIVLDEGKGLEFQTTKDAISHYLSNSKSQTKVSWEKNNRPGNNKVKINYASITPNNGEILYISEEVNFEINFENFVENASLDLTLELINEQGIKVFHVGTIFTKNKSSKKGLYLVKTKIPKDLLNSGYYSINIIFGENSRYALFGMLSILTFDLQDSSSFENMNKRPGIIKPNLEWSSKLLNIT